MRKTAPLSYLSIKMKLEPSISSHKDWKLEQTRLEKVADMFECLYDSMLGHKLTNNFN